MWAACSQLPHHVRQAVDSVEGPRLSGYMHVLAAANAYFVMCLKNSKVGREESLITYEGRRVKHYGGRRVAWRAGGECGDVFEEKLLT